MSVQLRAGATNVPGLGTSSYTVTASGNHFVSVQSTPPLNSQLQIVIQQNGSGIGTFGGTASNPSPTQTIINGKVSTNCAVGDILSVVFSSTSAADLPPNAVKSIVVISRSI